MQSATSKDGTTIEFWRSGSGPPLLLVHGTTADHSRWSAISPRLEEHFTVFAMDRRGRGGSADGPDYDILREAEDVAAVLEKIGEPSCVLGHSYGAICALEGVLLTDKVRKMVLYEPPLPTGLPAYPPAVPDRMHHLIESGRLESALELFMREVVRMPDAELAAYRQQPMWTERVKLAPTIPRELTLDRSYRFDPGRYASAHVPTLILVGELSPPLFRQAVDAVDSALPNGAVVILPDQRHIAMDMAPDLFVREVLEFLLT